MGFDSVSSTQEMLHETPMNTKADHSPKPILEESVSLRQCPILSHSPVKTRSGQETRSPLYTFPSLMVMAFRKAQVKSWDFYL